MVELLAKPAKDNAGDVVLLAVRIEYALAVKANCKHFPAHPFHAELDRNPSQNHELKRTHWNASVIN